MTVGQQNTPAYPVSLKAIVFADRDGRELLPLTARSSIALLPIAARPLIEFTLEALLLAKIQQVIVVIATDADRIEQYLQTGEQWGLQLDYVLSRGQEPPSQILKRLGKCLNEEEYLLIRADMLRSLQIRDFLRQAYQISTRSSILATVEGFNAGVCLVRKQKKLAWKISDMLQWQTSVFQKPLTDSELLDTGHVHLLPMPGQIALLDSLKNYHQAHVEIVQHLFPALVLKARKMNETLLVGRQSKVSLHNRGIVGSFCRVHDKAILEGNVVLSDAVIVDRYANLRNTVVLPNTYIGEAVELNNALVWGNTLIRVDTGATVQVVDNFLLTDIKSQTFSCSLARLFNRALGVGLLILSLPLWPLALFLAVWQTPYAPLQKVRLRGNLTWIDATGVVRPLDFTTAEWATQVALLRHLPKLFAVIKGHISVVGVSPQAPELLDTLIEPWERVRLEAPVGLIGPTQLQVPLSAPIEEKLLEDAYYAKTAHFGTYTFWLLRGLIACFSKRAWSCQST